MSRNLDRALEAIDEVLGHEGQTSPEEGYGVDRPGSCWRCLARAAETDTELCALCADYLNGDTDQDPTEEPVGPFTSYVRDGLRRHVVMDVPVRVTDFVARWGTPPTREGALRSSITYEVTPIIPPALRSPIQQAAEREQAIAVVARALEVSPEALENFAEGMRRIGVAAEEAMATIRRVFETTADALRETFERFAEEHQEAEDERRERDRARSRRALALYRRDPRRTLGPDLRATEAPRRAPHPNPRRRS